jgi:hypothetical protein
MKTETELQTSVHPSKQKLAKATIVAIVVALVILFVAILPAEYGIDPLGTGAALGLTSLSEAAAANTPQTPITTAPVVTGVYTAQPKTYKVDTEDINLAPGMGVEIKYHMEKGAGLIYSWKATGPVMFEFHGEPDQKPNKDYYDSYELVDKVGKTESHGTFTAPSTGIHGWFWENKGDKAVMVTLHTAGFYDSIKYFGASGEEELPAEDVQ